MKAFLITTSVLFLTTHAVAQTRAQSRSVSGCECEQVRVKTGQDFVAGGQQDGTQSVCKFSEFGFNGKVSFEGGWHLTGDLVAYNCAGGVAGSGRTTYGNSPSPLCRVTSFREIVATPGRCVHQADVDHDNRITQSERDAWTIKNMPITTGAQGYVGKVSQMAIDFWDLTYSLIVAGSDLCDPALKFSDPSAYYECQAMPVDCRRLQFVNQVNPIMSNQLVQAYSGYNNSLNHCVDSPY